MLVKSEYELQQVNEFNDAKTNLTVDMRTTQKVDLLRLLKSLEPLNMVEFKPIHAINKPEVSTRLY